ncbi:hypothetical protein GCM10020370_16930 [Paenibacillus hodogayensis]
MRDRTFSYFLRINPLPKILILTLSSFKLNLKGIVIPSYKAVSLLFKFIAFLNSGGVYETI